MNELCSLVWISRCDEVVYVWLVLKNMLLIVVLIVRLRLVLLRMISVFLLLSFSIVGVRLLVIDFRIVVFVLFVLVNESLVIKGCVVRVWFVVGLFGMMWNMFGGSMEFRILLICRIVCGVCFGGLMMMVLFIVSVGVVFVLVWIGG